MNNHPFLCFQSGGSQSRHLFVSQNPLEGGAINMSIGLAESDPQTQVKNLEEAEAKFIAFALATEVRETFDISKAKDVPNPLLISLINRQAGQIARRTRRGLGNVVLVSEQSWSEIEPHLSPFMSEPEAGPSNDRWTLRGSINRMQVYSTSAIPKGKLVVLYKGVPMHEEGRPDPAHYDGAAVYWEAHANFLQMLPYMSGSRCGPEGYISVIEIID